jgi:hypothetical protein
MKKWIMVGLGIHFLQAQYITHGPVTGGITPTSARVYVRTGFTSPFVLEVDDDSTFTSPFTYNVSIDPTKDSTIITDVTGLTSNTYYYVRFKFSGVADARKARLKTFPMPGQQTNFTLVTGSCQETANMNTFARMAEIDPLMMMHTGDFTYPSYQLDNTYPTNYTTMQLSWRKRYEENIMKDMLLKVPIDYINDDDDGYGSQKNLWISPEFTYDSISFDVHNYYTVDTIPLIGRYNHNRAYTEYFPHYPLVDTSQGLFHSYTIGNTEIFFLDTRSMADPVYESFAYDSVADHWSFAPDTSHTILGDIQMNWLKQGLLNSTADWKILFCGLPFNKNMRKLINMGLLFQNSVLEIGGSLQTGMKLATSFSNYWPGYPADQQELLDFIHINDIHDVLVASGDTHHNVIDDGTHGGLPEINASGLSVADLSLAYYLNQYLTPLGFPIKDSLWNKGGNGLLPDTSLLNAFGRLDIFKGDSLRMCVVDENGNNIACHTLINSSIIGVEPQGPSAFIKIFPNPTFNDLSVQMNPDFEFMEGDLLYLVNTEGKMVKQISKKPGDELLFNIQLHHQPSGVYYLIFDGAHGKFSKKIILQ